MAGFTERWPEIVSANPGGSDDPLGESVLLPEAPNVRVFEPRDTRLVLGRGQDPERELQVAAAQADGIPIHRRIAGGGAVVLAPGMVVVALRLPRIPGNADCTFGVVNACLIPAIAQATGVIPVCRGHGDLAIETDAGTRKILGSSLRQQRDLAIYLAVLLVDDAVPLMERYLAAPSREPDYRAGRGHAAFCTHLGAHGGTVASLRSALAEACQQTFGVDAA